MLSKLIISCLFVVSSISVFADDKDNSADIQVPDMQDIPRLKAGLAPGTIAWATPDQLHPTQPQTGLREVKRKAKRFEDMLKDDGKSFSKELLEFAYKNSVSPVFIAATPKKDSRAGEMDVLGFITDRTHGSNAQSHMIKKIYGKKGYREPIYDERGRPLNFILVKIMGDQSKMSEKEFAEFMVKNKHCYLKDWKRGADGETIVEDIDFAGLPETVYQTTDNPYRGLVGALQHDKELGRSDSDFSQFVDAQALLKHKIVEWDEISLDATDKEYNKAEKAAAKFFASPQAAGLPGATAQNSCDRVL